LGIDALVESSEIAAESLAGVFNGQIVIALVMILIYEKYRGINLTEKGMDIAKGIHDRHSILSEFLKRIGVSEGIANKDAESMEHHLHPQTIQRLTELMNTL
jgi:hypothetical protein